MSSQASTSTKAQGPTPPLPWPLGLDQWGTPVVPPKPDLGFFLRVLEEGLEGEAWPTGLDWDYLNSKTCAMALHMIFWAGSRQGPREIAKQLGLDHNLATRAFFFLIGPDGTNNSVTPQQVAKALQA